jgi:hypothetical protein
MEHFADDVVAWSTFYFTLAAVSGTLLGLLFVAISLNITSLRESKFADLRNMGNQTYVNYLLILLSSLVFLIPHQTPAGVGLPLLAFALIGLTLTIHQVRQFKRNPEHPITSAYIHRPVFMLQIAFVSLVCFGLIALMALLTLLEQPVGVYGVIVPIFVLIFAATQTTWDFLTHR